MHAAARAWSARNEQGGAVAREAQPWGPAVAAVLTDPNDHAAIVGCCNKTKARRCSVDGVGQAGSSQEVGAQLGPASRRSWYCSMLGWRTLAQARRPHAPLTRRVLSFCSQTPFRLASSCLTLCLLLDSARMQPMAWSFAQGQPAPTGRPLKRPASRECLAPHVKHPAVAAAVPPGSNAEAAAAAAVAAAPAADGIDVAAVAAKHGLASLGCLFICSLAYQAGCQQGGDPRCVRAAGGPTPLELPKVCAWLTSSSPLLCLLPPLCRWDLQQRNDYSNDRHVQWIPIAAIRRPLQGTRSNGEQAAEQVAL